jgi:hypothetical protein
VPEPSDHPIQETTHAIGGTPPGGTASSAGAGAPARLWYLSSQHMTLGVLTAGLGDGVLEAAPIAQGFVGQPLGNLVRWMGRQPGFRCEFVGSGPPPVPRHEPAEAARLIAEDFPAGRSGSTGPGPSIAGDLTRPDGNLTQAHLGLARPDPDLARAQLRGPGGMEL